jgi:hypothetical protein
MKASFFVRVDRIYGKCQQRIEKVKDESREKWDFNLKSPNNYEKMVSELSQNEPSFI